MMKKLVLGTAIAAALATSVAFAEDYQFELGASYTTGDEADTDFDGFGFYGEFHFDNVDTTKGPLNEAAFLDKSSSVAVGWDTSEADGADDSNDMLSVAGRFVTSSNWIFEVGYVDTSTMGSDDFVIGAGVGLYLNDNLDLVVSYATADEADSSSLGVDLHGVNSLSGETALAYDFGAAYLDDGEETGFGLLAGIDYYFNKSFNLGASVALTSVDEVDESAISVGVDYFVAPSIKLSADFVTQGQDADGSAFVLGAAVRF